MNKDKLRKEVLNLMLKNRRFRKGHQYTVPSTGTYPYQWFWDSCFHTIILSFFNDLGKTYINSNLTQKRLILSSIFDSRLAWSYPGFSNEQISPLYQAIRDFPDEKSPFGEPLSILNRLREFCELFLSDGLNSEFAYQFGLKNV